MDYIELSRRMRKQPFRDILIKADTVSTAVVFVSYPVLLLLAMYSMGERVFRLAAIPFIGLVIVTVFRKAFNRKRPFEQYGYRPVLKKKGKGKSFPSRHVFSAAVIALAWFSYDARAGIFFLAAAAVIAVIRVLGGVHYISDVAAGLIAGVVTGMFL